MKHKRGGRKGGRGGGRSRGSRGGSSSTRGNRKGYSSRNSDDRLHDDISSFARRQGLSDDFISLRNSRDSQIKVLKKLKPTKLNQINDMVDLNRGDFNNAEEMSLNSMMYERPRRKNRKENSMFNEVSYTSMHRGDIFNRSYRKLTIEFVKAKDPYDPSKELIEKLAQKNNFKYSQPHTEIPNIVEIAEELVRENELEQYLESDLEAYNARDDEMLSQEASDDVIVGNIEEDLDEDSDESSENDELTSINQSTLKDHRHVEVETGNELNREENGSVLPIFSKSPKFTFTKLEKKQKRSEIVIYDDNDEAEINISFEEDGDEDLDSLNENEAFDESDLDDFIEDNLDVNSDDILENLEADSDDSNEFLLGKFSGKMKKTKNGENYIELPALNKNKAVKSLPKSKNKATEKIIYSVNDETAELSIDDVVKHVNKKMFGDSGENDNEEPEETSEPEFGFLEEDYVSFDITQVRIENIRHGPSEQHKQFFVQAPILFGFDDFIWINRADFADLLTENGLPEHRFNAFTKKATEHLVPPDVAQAADDFDENELFISDSSDEDDEDDEDDVFTSSDLKNSTHSVSRSNNASLVDAYNSDDSLMNESELDEELMEGMDDLLNMHKLSKNNNFDLFEVNTRTTRIKGKGKRLKLEHNIDVDPEFQQYLHDKYIAQKNKRKDNKEEREMARKNNAYMLIRYPYLMEMQDIISEFKDFYKDPIRESLRFPPMDPHVHIVLKSISEAFGFPSKKIGKGSKQYVEIRKAHKSRSRNPDWNRIDRLAKKRNVCFRMDVNLSREEKRELKRIKGGDAEVEKMRNKGRGNFSYKEGEVVGATAKEIDSESIGRKLLEKMGWRTGEALGPDSNKGIVEPIKVVVKTSKRGIM